MRNLNELKVILYSFFILFNQLYLFSQDKSVNDEIFAIAEVFKVNKKAYGATSTQAKEFLKGTDKDNKAWESRKAAYAAIIYTDLTANPTKYSNGATHWDGREQAIYSADKRGISADGEFTDDKSKSKKVKL